MPGLRSGRLGVHGNRLGRISGLPRANGSRRVVAACGVLASVLIGQAQFQSLQPQCGAGPGRATLQRGVGCPEQHLQKALAGRRSGAVGLSGGD